MSDRDQTVPRDLVDDDNESTFSYADAPNWAYLLSRPLYHGWPLRYHRELKPERALVRKRKLTVSNEPSSKRKWFPVLFGSFVFLNAIGSGAFAQVHKAEYEGKSVACKIYGVKMSAEKIAEEINIHGSLAHPHLTRFIAPVEEINTKGHRVTCGFLMDLHKYSLRSFYVDRNGDASEIQKFLWARDLADVLAYVHKEGFCHWDVNPNNVVLSTGQQIVLIDLSLATSRQTSRPHSSGTTGYIAPELENELQEEQGTTVDGQKADVYSFGKTFLYIFTKKDSDPNEGSSLQMPEIIVDQIKRCLEKDPEKRPTMEEVYTKLREYVQLLTSRGR